jgi:hypothetical protein
VLVHDESFLVNPKDPIWRHYQPFKWWLLAHGLTGACAMVLAPMQFSDRLRQHYTRLHRRLRIYRVSAWNLHQSFSGAPRPRSFTMAAVTHGVLWLATTGIAFALILNGKVQQHRQWMTRSMFVGPVAFVAPRAILGITGWQNAGPAVAETVVWMCVAFSLLFADAVLQWQDLSRSHPIIRTAQAVAQHG